MAHAVCLIPGARNLPRQVKELKQELSALRVAKVTGGAASKLAKIKEVRKNVARVLTVLKQNQREALKEVFAGKKYTPLDLRVKKTRAIRRRLTEHQVRRGSACVRWGGWEGSRLPSWGVDSTGRRSTRPGRPSDPAGAAAASALDPCSSAVACERAVCTPALPSPGQRFSLNPPLLPRPFPRRTPRRRSS